MIDSLKQMVKQNLSERRRRQILCLRASLSFTGLCVSLIKLLPTRSAVRIKERLKLVGKLDYQYATVLMNLDSVTQLARLGACQKEPETVAWLETQLRPGDVLFDIGANVGAYSFLAASIIGKKIRVYAFEPGFATFAQLCQNVLLNNCQDKVIPLQIALSNRTALLDFNYHTVFPGGALHSLGEPIDYAGRIFQPVYVQQVLSFRIDDLVKRFLIEPPTLIKLDVDGIEPSVLQGASDTLLHPKLRSILVEVSEERGQIKEITGFLESKGFRLKTQQIHGTTDIANLIFIRSSVAQSQ